LLGRSTGGSSRRRFAPCCLVSEEIAMTMTTMWEGLQRRAQQLRDTAGELTKKAYERREKLPDLALAAQEQRDGAPGAFAEALSEIQRLVLEATQAEYAAGALDQKAADARREDREFERLARTREMSDARAGFDHAVSEMDKALKDVEDAYAVLRDATTDYAGALRLANFGDAAASLQRRASRMLQAACWANAPRLTKGLGVEMRLRHHAQPITEATGFLPAKIEDEQQ
jgi:hypothetical protein